ncbi:FAD-dependent monooxygenase [Nonomuraea sp. NBC_01738]|uniref:FAD-dependent monooxygenase n=1 Tax=Nonomuraea sp. NBC_01738 TaxID=2976003 RepID=UPI002E108759|nr:FAD-dependent monooxygenase [Nonomuraea sp. NBC_01738]
MLVACAGGGPAGLYFSILMKLRDPSHDVTVYERGPAGSTYGWGVTYWAGLLDKLGAHDPESALAIRDASVCWSDGVAHVAGRTGLPGSTRHRGDQGFGIGRRTLLDLLADRARSLGVRVEYEHGVTEPPAADLVLACDGVRSTLRGPHEERFGTEITTGRNTYIWLGTTKVFDAFTFSFVETEHGWIWCYGYGYDAGHSTCVIECAPATWAGLGLDTAGEAGTMAVLEKVFADVLDGHPLMGRALWLNFPTVTNRVWRHGNTVLAGDAAHTTHYSIGAGTTLALEDAMALAAAVHECPDLDSAFGRYERERRAALLPVQSAARYSARWYESLPRYIGLPPERMFALLGQRHSPLLPHLPPGLYYRLDRAAGSMEGLRAFKRWLGPRLARALHNR